MNNNKIKDEYDSMDRTEKFAMRYGAEGRSLGDVVRYSPEKITSPNKVFDAWTKGDDLRNNGKSRTFLDDLEKRELDTLYSKAAKKSNSAPNGISAEPIKDAWGKDLFKTKKEGGNLTDIRNSPDYKAVSGIKEVPFIPEEKFTQKNLLQTEKDYDIMYTGSVANSSPKTDYDTYVTYGYSDKNVVGGIQSRLKEMGYRGVNGNIINITGTFDEDTEICIKEFQKNRGLPVTGIFDDATKTEMGFRDDYSVLRQGRNATPWNHQTSSPFDFEAYTREQERLKREKEEEEEEKNNNKESKNSHAFLSFLADTFAEFFYNHGGAQPFTQESDIIYDEYQKNIENDLNELSKRYGEQAIYNYMEGIKSQNP